MEKIKKSDIRLEQTCCACPEQYDAFLRDTNELIGYLRLRGGYFRVDYPNSGGETIYEANPKGDGCFESEEREFYIKEAKKAIKKKYNEQHSLKLDNIE